jgi:hypothetical protein
MGYLKIRIFKTEVSTSNINNSWLNAETEILRPFWNAHSMHKKTNTVWVFYRCRPFCNDILLMNDWHLSVICRVSVFQHTFWSVIYNLSVLCPFGHLWLSVLASAVINLRTDKITIWSIEKLTKCSTIIISLKSILVFQLCLFFRTYHQKMFFFLHQNWHFVQGPVL